MAPFFGKSIIPKEVINTQKVTNAPNLINQSDPPAPKVIMMDEKIWTDVYLLSIGTGSGVTQGKIISTQKRNMKSPAMSPPRKYLITNQYNKRSGTKKIEVFYHI